MLNTNTIFFDLDHTLWDYDVNAHQTLTEIYEKFGLNSGYETISDFVSHFLVINEELWDLYNHGKVSREYIRKERFKKILIEAHQDLSKCEPMSDYFMEECPKKPALIPGTIDLLEYLSGKYRMAIITNGFTDTQGIKLTSGGISHYFDEVITSETAQARKPSSDIFHFALEKMKVEEEVALMIGDNLKTDIAGANNAGWQSIWFTQEESSPPKNCRKVNALSEIKDLL